MILKAVELYNGNTLLGSYSQTIERTANADLRTDPSMYTVELRIRGNKVRVYSGSSYTLRFTATVSGFSGAMPDTDQIPDGLRAAPPWRCVDLRAYERFDVTFQTAQLRSMAGSAGRTPRGIRNFRCLR